jgi:hypothetical protein
MTNTAHTHYLAKTADAVTHATPGGPASHQGQSAAKIMERRSGCEQHRSASAVRRACRRRRRKTRVARKARLSLSRPSPQPIPDRTSEKSTRSHADRSLRRFDRLTRAGTRRRRRLTQPTISEHRAVRPGLVLRRAERAPDGASPSLALVVQPRCLAPSATDASFQGDSGTHTVRVNAA